MEVIKLNEAGYNEAKYGFSLSFKDRSVPREEWWCHDDPLSNCNDDCNTCKLYKRILHYDSVLKANAPRNGGHNKFLEHIIVWLDIEMPRYWWSEFDTYRVGVSKQSESTMHTLEKRKMTVADLDSTEEDPLNLHSLVSVFNKAYDYVKAQKPKNTIQILKRRVPDSYLQRREVVLSYKVLAHIAAQRYNHRLPEWQFFINEVYKQVEHPELLPDRSKL